MLRRLIHMSSVRHRCSGYAPNSFKRARPIATHFGFQDVDDAAKAGMVGQVFHRVADKYDVMNDLMSSGLHRLWKDCFVAQLEPVAGGGSRETVVLDVAGGTGDIAFRIIESLRRQAVRPHVPPHVIVSDINASMLAVGRSRAVQLGYLPSPTPTSEASTTHTGASTRGAARTRNETTRWTPRLSFLEDDAEVLRHVPDASVDLYTIAFGIRNVTHVDKAIEQAYRVLKPGGRFSCLEFSALDNAALQQVYDWYSFSIIPAMGEVVAQDRPAYQYLVESIRRFPKQEDFAQMLRAAGFSHVSYENQTFGVCAIHSGFKT